MTLQENYLGDYKKTKYTVQVSWRLLVDIGYSSKLYVPGLTYLDIGELFLNISSNFGCEADCIFHIVPYLVFLKLSYNKMTHVLNDWK